MLKKGVDYKVEGYRNLWSVIDTHKGYALLENCTYGDETCNLVVPLAQEPVPVRCRKGTGEVVERLKITKVLCETFDSIEQALIDEGRDGDEECVYRAAADHIFVAKRRYEGDRTLIIFADDLANAKEKAQAAFGLSSVFVHSLTATDDPQVYEV